MTPIPVRDIPSHTAEATSRLRAARQRLDRLEGFLRHDPANNTLRIDAFETALSCGDWERAGLHLQQGKALPSDLLPWKLREGDFLLAQRRYDEAAQVLEALTDMPESPPGFAEVLLHNLAYIELHRGRFAECALRLETLMEGSVAATREPDGTLSPATCALQRLWLRALHHDGQFERAMAWTLMTESAGDLDVHASGIASLIAVDAADFSTAQRWSTAALAAAEPDLEALLTRASLALAVQDADGATRLADEALQLQPDNGRAWSVRGFAALLKEEVDDAIEGFERALAVMGEHVGTWHGLAWAWVLKGDLPVARTHFETALALDRNFAESHGGLAVVSALQGDLAGARSLADVALRLDPRNLSGRYAQALSNGELRAPADVQRFARRLMGDRAGALGGRAADFLPDVQDDAPPGA